MNDDEFEKLYRAFEPTAREQHKALARKWMWRLFFLAAAIILGTVLGRCTANL